MRDTSWTRWYLIRPRASRSGAPGRRTRDPFKALAGACSTTGTSRSSTGAVEVNSAVSTVSGSQMPLSTNAQSGVVTKIVPS